MKLLLLNDNKTYGTTLLISFPFLFIKVKLGVVVVGVLLDYIVRSSTHELDKCILILV